MIRAEIEVVDLAGAGALRARRWEEWEVPEAKEPLVTLRMNTAPVRETEPSNVRPATRRAALYVTTAGFWNEGIL